MKRKILKLVSISLSLIMTFALIYTVFAYLSRDFKIAEGVRTKEFAADGDTEERFSHRNDNYTDVLAINESYVKPDITLDDVIKELSNYGHVKKWNQGSSGYLDFWEGKNQRKYICNKNI